MLEHTYLPKVCSNAINNFAFLFWIHSNRTILIEINTAKLAKILYQKQQINISILVNMFILKFTILTNYIPITLHNTSTTQNIKSYFELF